MSPIIDNDSNSCYFRIIKTTVDIPEAELRDAIKYVGVKTKRAAIVQVVVEFNRRQRIAELDQILRIVRHFSE